MERVIKRDAQIAGQEEEREEIFKLTATAIESFQSTSKWKPAPKAVLTEGISDLLIDLKRDHYNLRSLTSEEAIRELQKKRARNPDADDLNYDIFKDVKGRLREADENISKAAFAQIKKAFSASFYLVRDKLTNS